MVEDTTKAQINTSAKANDGSTNDKVEQELYAKRKKIYPREVHGLFAALRTMGVEHCSVCITSFHGCSGMSVRRCCLICRNVNSISSTWCSGRRISFILHCY